MHHRLLYDDDLPSTAMTRHPVTVQVNEQTTSVGEVMKRMKEVERMADAVKDSMAGELNKVVRLVYEKLCQIEDELASLQELVTQTGRDLGAKQCEAAQSLQGCGDGINTLISLLQKTRIK